VRSLKRLIEEAGFATPQILLPDITDAQRNQFGKGMRMLIDLYQIAKNFSASRELLYWIGPSLQAVAKKKIFQSINLSDL